MLYAVYRQAGLAARHRLTWLKIAVCLIIIYTALYVHQQPGRPSPAVSGRPPLASFVHRPHLQPSAVTSDDHGKIPKIVHQTWKSQSDLPETFRPWMSSWLRYNKDWQYWLWTDADIRRLITTVFPRHLAMFDNYPAHAYRVDAFRRENRLCSRDVVSVLNVLVSRRSRGVFWNVSSRLVSVLKVERLGLVSVL